VFTKTPLLDMSLNEWDHLHQVNVRAMVVTMQAITPSMRVVGGGRVVNMASMAAKRGTPGEAAYAASKDRCCCSEPDCRHGVGLIRHHGQLDLPRLCTH